MNEFLGWHYARERGETLRREAAVERLAREARRGRAAGAGRVTPRHILAMLMAATTGRSGSLGHRMPSDRLPEQSDNMIEALRAAGPHSDGDGLMLFGQFVGAWGMDIRLWDRDGTEIFHRPGVWSFGWVLDGRAVQDVLVTPDAQGRSTPGLRGIGTTLRSYDPSDGTWRAAWVAPARGLWIPLRAGGADHGILVEGTDMNGDLLRWTFSDIAADSFHWTGRTSSDGGASWWKEQEMEAVRRAHP